MTDDFLADVAANTPAEPSRVGLVPVRGRWVPYRTLFPRGSTLDRLHRDPPDAAGLYHDRVHVDLYRAAAYSRLR